MKKLTHSWLMLALILPFACLPARTNTARMKATDGDEFARYGWIEKVSRTLSCGKTAASQEEIEALAQLPDGEVVDKLMQGARFEATILDFTKYFHNSAQTQTGCQNDINGLSNPAQLQNIINNYSFTTPNILRAAKAATANEDFLGELFAEGPVSILPPIKVKGASATTGVLVPVELPLAGVSAAEQAAVYRDELLKRLDFVIAEFGADGAVDGTKGCKAVYGKEDGAVGNQNQLNIVSFRTMNNAGISNLFDGAMTQNWFGQANNDCSTIVFAQPPPVTDPPTPPVDLFAANNIDPKALRDRLIATRPKIESAFKLAMDYNTEVYNPKSLAELKSAPARDAFFLPEPPGQFGGGGFGVRFPYLDFGGLQNSSTNYNRKRGAFMLKTFFCDDLTPVAIVAPEAHGEGAHGSDPGCQACHYKLDPMSGFFRELGGFGPGFEAPGTALTNLVFSDGKVIQGEELTKYLDTWRAPENAGRPWNVGYVRSTTKPAANFYASNLKELYGFMATAPEVRSCVVRRMAEYFVSKNQAYDGGWLSHLETKLKPTEDGGTTGMKTVVRELMLSKAFAEPDPVSTTCYDQKPGATPSGLPCEVAWTLKVHCEKCHKDDTTFDLSQWKPMTGGNGFPHFDEDGKEIGRLETFKRIKARLDTPDKAKRMPKNQDMPDADRARLYKWIAAVLDGAGGTTP